MASLASFTRYAAQATFSAYRRTPIRGRLAGGSAALTFVILCGFAAIVGVLTTRTVRGQFADETASAVESLASHIGLTTVDGSTQCTGPNLSTYGSAEHAQIRVYAGGTGFPVCATQGSDGKPVTAPYFNVTGPGVSQQHGYRVDVRTITGGPLANGYVVYARPISDVEHTLAKVRFILILSVLGGTGLALLAGLAIAQRAMRPVAELTDAAREIERTRDPGRRLPHPEADDEVGELSRTLEAMLAALGAARADTEAALGRQREFVADASHELRTPLTSVLANLELLAEELDGEQAETAQAALRSTRRMRRLVADLLLLARADGKREQPFHPVDVGLVLTEVAGELEPVAGGHELMIDPRPAVVAGVGDDLHRLLLNLIENAIRHTPPGTRIHAMTRQATGGVQIVVEDDGPGIPPELAGRVFERFVRGGGDGGRGSGLGLAIVSAVVTTHGGNVSLTTPEHGGTRFVITLPTPAAGAIAAAAGPERSGAGGLAATERRV